MIKKIGNIIYKLLFAIAAVGFLICFSLPFGNEFYLSGLQQYFTSDELSLFSMQSKVAVCVLGILLWHKLGEKCSVYYKYEMLVLMILGIAVLHISQRNTASHKIADIQYCMEDNYCPDYVNVLLKRTGTQTDDNE